MGKTGTRASVGCSRPIILVCSESTQIQRTSPFGEKSPQQRSISDKAAKLRHQAYGMPAYRQSDADGVCYYRIAGATFAFRRYYWAGFVTSKLAWYRTCAVGRRSTNDNDWKYSGGTPDNVRDASA